MRRSFVVLSTYQYALLGHQLAALARHDARPAALILDSRELSAADARRLAERTGGAFPWRPLHETAAGVPVSFVESHNDATTLGVLDRVRPDFIVNAGTPRILSGAILSAAPLGVLNCHPGRLPDYRGCTCPEWAIYNGDPVCNTVHRMSAGIDEGPVLMIEEVKLPARCTYQEMRVAVYRDGIELLARASRALQEGSLGAADFIPQSDGTYRKPIDDDRMAVVRQKLQQGIHPERDA